MSNQRKSVRSGVVVASVCVVSLVCLHAQATQYTFVPGGANDWWMTNTNWSPVGVPNSVNDVVVFNASALPGYSTNVHNAWYTVQEARFNTPSTWRIHNNRQDVILDGPAGSASITQNGSGAVTFDCDLQLNDTTTFTGTGTGDITVNGSGMPVYRNGIYGTGGLVKQGGYTLVLRHRNTYAGDTTVDAGTLTINAPNSASSALGPGTLFIHPGATVDTYVNGFGWTYQNPIHIDGGTLRSIGADSHVNAVTMTGGLMTGQEFRPHMPITTNAAPTSALINVGTLRLYGNIPFNVADGPAGIDLDVTSQVRGGGSVQKTGPGTMRMTRSDNDYSGGTVVDGGVLLLQGQNLGQSTVGTNTLTINGGGTVTAQSHNVFGHTSVANIPHVVLNGGVLNPYQYLHVDTVEMTGGTINAGPAGGAGLQTHASVFTTHASAATATIHARIQAAMGDITFNVADGGADPDLLVTSRIYGGNSASKNGAGTLTLTGSGGGYTFASMTNNDGVLELRDNGSGSGDGFRTAVVNNATLWLTSSGPVSDFRSTITGPGAIVKKGPGMVRLGPWGGTAQVTGSGDVIVETGTLQSAGRSNYRMFDTTGDLVIDPGATFDYSALNDASASTGSRFGALLGSGNLTVGWGTHWIQLGNADKSGAFSGVIGGNLHVTKIGTGTQVFSGNNNYAGTTDIAAGTLVLDGNGTYSGRLAGGGNLVKDGAGTVTLRGVNSTFSGNVAVNDGTLLLNGGPNQHPIGSNPSRTITIGPGATLTAAQETHNPFGTGGEPPTAIVNGGTMNSAKYQHMQDIEMTGGLIQPSGSQVDGLDMRGAPSVVTVHGSGATATINSKMTIRSGVTFDVANGAADPDLLMSGPIVGGSAVKTGAGTMTLTGSGGRYTFGGITNNDGILELRDNGSGSGDGFRTAVVNNATLWLTSSGPVSDFRSTITGPGAIVKKGPGMVRLGPWGGVAQVTGSGDVVVEAGTLQSAGRSNYRMFDTTGDLVLNPGTTFDYSALNDASAATASRFGALRGSGNIATGWGTHYVQFGNGDKSGDFAGTIGGALSVTKIGNGTQVLRGANTYNGSTTVSAGTLLVNGSVAGDVTVAAGVLGGYGGVRKIGGAGLVSPGDAVGILTATSLDPAAGTDFGFVYTAPGSPNYGNASDSINDVLRLTDASPFPASLTAANEIGVYLNVDGLSVGDAFEGGFYTDTGADFLPSIEDAALRFFVKGDGLGTHPFEGVNYYALSEYSPDWHFSLATVPQTANFGAGNVDGYVMQLTGHVPEPATLALLGLGVVGLGGYVRRRFAGRH